MVVAPANPEHLRKEAYRCLQVEHNVERQRAALSYATFVESMIVS